MTTQQKLERLRNRQTKYELVASHPDGRRLLIRYTSRTGRNGLYDALAQDAERLCRVLGADDITWGKRSADGGTMGEWVLRFSGRTQREAIIDGEHTFYADLDAKDCEVAPC
jgi:hypothetical protein